VIDRDAYLAYAAQLTERERVLITDFRDWLPATIIDCHAHCNLSEHVHSVDARAYGHMLSTFPSFTLEESSRWHAVLHSGTNIRSLRFPKTFRGVDHRAANDYLLTNSAPDDRVALYGLPDDPEYTLSMLNHSRVSALKMYYSYLEPPATKIYEYFPKLVLAAAQAHDIPIVLHPPRNIVVCLDQIIRLSIDFPRLRVCLAHLSLTKSLVPGLETAFHKLASYPNVVFDTALVPSAEVVSMAIELVGVDRIMYGSDEPLNLIRSVPYTHPEKGERLATDYPYHWVDPKDFQRYRHLAANATHAHWSALGAIRSAIARLPIEKQEATKLAIFHDNAKRFYRF